MLHWLKCHKFLIRLDIGPLRHGPNAIFNAEDMHVARRTASHCRLLRCNHLQGSCADKLTVN